MTKLSKVERPEDQREDYFFFLNEETGQTFKAMHELRNEDQSQPVLVVSTAPVDESGKAIRMDSGEPAIHYHSHTFTEHELRSDDFDLNKRVVEILKTMVPVQERELKSRERVKAVTEGWKAGSLNLDLD